MTRYLEAVEAQVRSGSDDGELEDFFPSSARQLVQEQLPDLDSTLADRRAYTAGFRVWLRARWGEALDLFELLVSECSDIGGEVNEQYRPRAVESQDHRFSTHETPWEGIAHCVRDSHAPRDGTCDGSHGQMENSP